MIHLRLGIGLACGVCLASWAFGAEESVETTGVLQVPAHRQAAQLLETAAAHLDRGENARAAGLLESLWLDARQQVAGDDRLLTSLADLILPLAQRLPETEREQFWERIEASAADQADALLLGSPTHAGLRAIERFAARLKDSGNFELAAAASLRATNHPVASKLDRWRNQSQRVDLLAELSGPDVVRDWLSSMTADVRHQTVLIADESITVEAWLMRERIAPSSSPTAVNLDRPALTPQWEWTAPVAGNLAAGLTRAGEDLRSQGLSRLSHARPVVIGSRIVTRTLTGLVCIDAASGQLIWELPNRQAADRAALAGQQNNPLFSGKLHAALTQQFQTNSLLGAMTHDDRAVYHVIEAAATEPSKPLPGYVLEAVNVETGKRMWRSGAPTKSKDDTVRELDWRPSSSGMTGQAKGISVCGPPLVLGNRLYLLAEQSSELIFLAVNFGSLEVEWTATVGQLLPDANRAAPRTYTAAPVIWTGDSVVCVTNCGAVVAIDPIEQRVRWIARYPIELWSVGRLDPTSLDPSPAASLRTWRDASIWHSQDRLVCVSPESPRIHVLEASTGRSLLTIPRESGVKLLGVDAGRILVLEPLAIRAHDMTNGQVIWRTVIGEIRGTGLVTGNRIVQPLADGPVASLDVADGRRLPGAIGRSGSTSGNLIPLSDGWLSADEFRLRKFADVRLALRDYSAEPRARAELKYATGEFDAARRELATLDEDPARQLARAVDLAELRFHPERLAQVRDNLLSRSQTPEEKAEDCFALAEAAWQQRRWDEAASFALNGLDLDHTSIWTMDGEPLRRVRADRAFQGLISTALEQADESQRATIGQKLAERWRLARDQADPFALQRLEQRWRTLEFTRNHVVDDAEAIFLGTSLIARESALLAATRGLKDETGLRVAWTLREEWQTSGFARDAAAIEWRMLTSAPGRLLAGQTVRGHLLEQGAPLEQRLQSSKQGPTDVWPAIPPRITSTKDSSEDAYQTVIPVEAEAGGVWDRVDVTVDRQGQVLRFTGDDQSGAWTVSVPRGGSQLQQYPLTYQGWGWGRLLLTRLGTQLVAVSPWNEHGEPEARLLWSMDLLGAGAQLPEQLVVERSVSPWKRGHETFRIIDQYGRDICLVGPVRPGYLCYLQQGKLIAADTQTGQRLWERWDIAPGVIPWGDDEHVVLFSPGEQTYETLSARDGEQMALRSCAARRSEIWHAADGKIWTGEQHGGLRLICRDLVKDERQWERLFPHDCLPIALEDQTGAVLDPRGVLHLIDLQTGATLDEPLTVELPRPIERMLVSRDESRWYLGVSGPVDRSFEWTKEQPSSSYRRPLLHGPLVAIDRWSRQIVWQREIGGEPWLLDQNKSMPVLVQIFKTPPPMNGQGIGEGVLRLIDKRTGREVLQHRDLNLLPYFSLEPQPDYLKFEVRTNNTLFQVDYGPEEEE